MRPVNSKVCKRERERERERERISEKEVTKMVEQTQEEGL